jgi:hypothetical protein
MRAKHAAHASRLRPVYDSAGPRRLLDSVCFRRRRGAPGDAPGTARLSGERFGTDVPDPAERQASGLYPAARQILRRGLFDPRHGATVRPAWRPYEFHAEQSRPGHLPACRHLRRLGALWRRPRCARGARRIETFGSYNCRDIAGTDRLSAHATANAIDVAAFDLADGRRISVKADWNGGSLVEREFLRIVHKSACKRFGTVLGPGYNAAHKDHFHLERSASSFCG